MHVSSLSFFTHRAGEGGGSVRNILSLRGTGPRSIVSATLSLALSCLLRSCLRGGLRGFDRTVPAFSCRHRLSSGQSALPGQLRSHIPYQLAVHAANNTPYWHGELNLIRKN